LRILFDLRGTGLGNNGGSLTIVKSANVLQELGHKVSIIDSMKNQHKWIPLKTNHIIVKKESDIPDADCIIATGYGSVPYVISSSERCGKKFHWIRGWELWRMNEKKIVLKVLNVPTVKIVNSSGLKKKLKSFNIHSHLVFPGNDIEDFHVIGNMRERRKVIIGGLYHSKHKTKKSLWIINIADKLKRKYPKRVSLFMFGEPRRPNIQVIDEYFRQPNIEEKNIFYNKINIWISPSDLEGLHIVPQEAMLCGCCVIGVDSPLSGTSDYLFHGKTGIYSENDYNSLMRTVEKFLFEFEIQKKIGKEARKQIISNGDRYFNMRKFIDVLKREGKK